MGVSRCLPYQLVERSVQDSLTSTLRRCRVLRHPSGDYGFMSPPDRYRISSVPFRSSCASFEAYEVA